MKSFIAKIVNENVYEVLTLSRLSNYQLFMKISNKIGARIRPWGTPEIILISIE